MFNTKKDVIILTDFKLITDFKHVLNYNFINMFIFYEVVSFCFIFVVLTLSQNVYILQ